MHVGVIGPCILRNDSKLRAVLFARFPLGLAPLKLDDDGFTRRFDKFAKDLSAFLAECEP